MATFKELIEERKKSYNNIFYINEYIWEKIKKSIGKMPRKTYWILRYRHRDRMTLEEIAQKYSVTRERILQLVREGEEILDKIMTESDDFIPEYKIDKYEL